MEFERIKTGCKAFDNLLNGGLEPGVITNFYGEAGTGKSNLSMIFALKTIEKGKKCIFIDTEGSLSLERMKQIQTAENYEKPIKNLIVFEPTNFGEQHKIIMNLEKNINPDIGLVVVDSLVSLYRLELSNSSAEEVNRKLAMQMAKLAELARKNKISVLITTQVYSSLETKTLEIVSRDIARYWSKILIKLERIGPNKRRATIIKHRSMPEGLEAEFYIDNKGISDKRLRIF